MSNQTLKFKTNINCGGCISKVKPALDEAVGANNWAVDTDNPEKILSITSEEITSEEVINLIKTKGFKAEEI